ncbi:MAG TPA: P-loop NTPase fold protein [Streptosporangiaceae bacterium]|nr:P-loop NTPase fold protein [Streptosporangiaceae bacterium]
MAVPAAGPTAQPEEIRLAIGRLGDEYSLSYNDSRAEGSSGPLRLSATPDDIDALSRSRQEPRAEAAPRPPVYPEDFGASLFQDVFSGDVLRVLDAARSGLHPVRLTIELDDDPLLRQIPWELLYDTRLREFLALTGVSVSRAIPPGLDKPAMVAVSRPLRVLIATASLVDAGPEPPPDQVSSKRPDLTVSVLKRASTLSLRRAIAEFAPHIVQLSTAPLPTPDGSFSFDFEDSGGQRQWTSPALIASMLVGQPSVRLLLLTEGPVGTSAALFAQAGVPATLTMQFKMTASGLAQFCTTFYDALLGGASIDGAVAAAREQLGQSDPLTWGCPVVWVGSPAYLRTSLAEPFADSGGTVPANAAPPVQAGPTTEGSSAAVTSPAHSSVEESTASTAEEPTLSTPASSTQAPAAAALVELGTQGGADNDAVGGEDRLGFRYYVDAFADLITSPFTQPPLTIGIFGSWGMGKSFLLEHIERQIGERQQPGGTEPPSEAKSSPLKIHVVPFNAWEFSETERVWPGLVRKIVRTLDVEVPWPWYKRYWTRLRWNLPRQIRRQWIPLTSAILASAVAIGVLFWQDRADIASALIGVVGLLSVGGLVRAASNPAARWVTTLFADSDYGEQIGYMEDIRHDLETLEARLHEGGKPTGPVTGRILVVVDDLDRCEPDKAVEMLQAVNLLLNFRSFIVCLGIDARIVSAAIEQHYQGLLGEAGASGYEYLDKIVQIPFQIPVPSEEDIKTFIASQMGNPVAAKSTAGTAPASDGAREAPAAASGPLEGSISTGTSDNGANAAAPRDSAGPVLATSSSDPTASGPRVSGGPTGSAPASETPTASPPTAPPAAPEASVPFSFFELQAFHAVAPFLRPNPRHLKRLLNIYRLVRALARAKDERALLDHPEATICWLVVSSQWPYTARAMMDCYDRLLDQWRDSVPEDVRSRDPLQYLLARVGPVLDLAARDKYDDDPALLRDLLALPGSGFGWPELRRLRGYTVNLNPAILQQLRLASVPAIGDAGPDVTVPAQANGSAAEQPGEPAAAARKLPSSADGTADAPARGPA